MRAPPTVTRPMLGLVVASALVVGCARERPAPRHALAVPLDVLADTAATHGGAIRMTPTLPLPAPSAAAWVAQVAPSRNALDAPLPSTAPESLVAPPAAAPPLAIDDDLKPPIPRAPARLVLPRGARRGVVELDVRVDERGEVTDALWAGGEPDSALVAAATTCALSMRFRPAERAGRPVAVWCRQRFDLVSGGH